MNKVTTKETTELDMLYNPPQHAYVELQTNRYTYNPEVVIHLSNFAKIHEYDDRKDFKEAWQKWIDDPEINKIIMDEVTRLQTNGQMGDVLDRMYKSARYYYRKKKETTPNQQIEPRKEYEGLPRPILKSIDDHIYAEINNNIILSDKVTGMLRSNISAANSFTNYCRLHSDVIKDLLPKKEVENVTYRANNLRDEIKVVTDKLKKTYKNRFYKIKVNLKE